MQLTQFASSWIFKLLIAASTFTFQRFGFLVIFIALPVPTSVKKEQSLSCFSLLPLCLSLFPLPSNPLLSAFIHLFAFTLPCRHVRFLSHSPFASMFLSSDRFPPSLSQHDPVSNGSQCRHLGFGSRAREGMTPLLGAKKDRREEQKERGEWGVNGETEWDGPMMENETARAGEQKVWLGSRTWLGVFGCFQVENSAFEEARGGKLTLTNPAMHRLKQAGRQAGSHGC